MTTKTVKQENKLQTRKPNKKQCEKNKETKQKSDSKKRTTHKVDIPKKNVTVKKSKSKTKPTYIGGAESESNNPLTIMFRDKLTKFTIKTCSYVIVNFIKGFLRDITSLDTIENYKTDVINTFLNENFETITIAQYIECDKDDGAPSNSNDYRLGDIIDTNNNIDILKKINNLTEPDYHELHCYKLKEDIDIKPVCKTYTASNKFEINYQCNSANCVSL